MLTTRLWMGSVLIALVLGMLVFDFLLFPWFPFQLVFQLGLAVVGCREMVKLLGDERAPIVPLCYLGVVTLTLANWRMFKTWYFTLTERVPFLSWWTGWEEYRHWTCFLAVVVGVHFVIFLWEMAQYREGGQSFERMARTWWVVGYLGLLPSFFGQIRWHYLPDLASGTTALALTIFVPKGCDIGAYFTGRLFGRHPMTPVLSPKKTWEGAIGGLALAVLIAIGIDRFSPVAVLGGNLALEIGFGLSVGLAGMLGDLAESLMKRDCRKKDASQVVPGFGGILDVVDAVIFAAPVAYLWFACMSSF